MKSKIITYVAYAPYENQGRILEYILENFKNVCLFSIGHHSLGESKKTNKLTVYKDNKIVKEVNLFYIPVASSLVFSILPLRSLLNFTQILFLIIRLYKDYGKIDIYFSVNGYAAWMGLVFKKLGFVRKTSYWICDYYPIYHKNKIVQAVRWLYWRFERLAAKSDKLSFHNLRLVKAWRENGANFSKRYSLVPIGTQKAKTVKRKNINHIRLVFLGVVKKSQGLDYIFNAAKTLQEFFPNIQLRVLGPGPDTDYFKNRAMETELRTHFYGYVNEKDIDRVILESTIGIAPYMPDPTTVSYYGDPGKIKRYISLGLPVIATNIHEFSERIEKDNAGVLVEYGNVCQLVGAIKKINSNYETMSKNAIKLNKKYYYKDIYPKMFGL